MGYLNPHTHQLDAPPRPRIAVLCGSTRFKGLFARANQDLTLGGRIVLAPGVFGHADGIELTEETKAALDALHLRKIDLADEVVVISDATGYIGDSTRREIAYAQQAGKFVWYFEPPDEPTGPPTPHNGLPLFTLHCSDCGIDHCTRCHSEHRCATCNTLVGHAAGYHCTSCKDTSKRVADWNRDFPVPAPVMYSSVKAGGFSNPRQTTTRGVAWVSPSGQAVVTVDGVGGWVLLDHVSPLGDPSPAGDLDPPECTSAPDGEHCLHGLDSGDEDQCCHCDNVIGRANAEDRV